MGMECLTILPPTSPPPPHTHTRFFIAVWHLVDAFAVYAVTAVAGLHVVIPGFDAGAVLRAIPREAITVTHLASTMVSLLLVHPQAGTADFSSLRLVSCGGSPLAPDTARRAIAFFGCPFFQSYGLTETSGGFAGVGCRN